MKDIYPLYISEGYHYRLKGNSGKLKANKKLHSKYLAHSANVTKIAKLSLVDLILNHRSHI